MRSILQGGGTDRLKQMDITLSATSTGTYNVGTASRMLADVGIANPIALELVSAVATNVSPDMNKSIDNNLLSLSSTWISYSFQPRVSGLTTGTVIARVYYWDNPTTISVGTINLINKALISELYTVGG